MFKNQNAVSNLFSFFFFFFFREEAPIPGEDEVDPKPLQELLTLPF